jgi:hypothetical protein
MKRRNNRGIVLMTAIVVAFIMSLWVVAALYRNSFMSSGVLYSYHKSESLFLAKTATSRALYYLNGDAGWLGRHSDKTSGDTSTEGAVCWAETTSDGIVLKCEARVGAQTTTLSVPLKTLSSNDTHLYSITPSSDGGPDLIAWKTSDGEAWNTLPLIPGSSSIAAVTGAGNGDVFTVATGADGTSAVWRYRAGRGWVKMPDLPSGVSLTAISVGDSARLVGLGSNNTLQVLNLNAALDWTTVPAPAGVTMQDSAMAMNDSSKAFVTGIGGSALGASIHRYDFDGASWTEYPSPVAAHFDPGSGQLAGESGPVPNFAGGIAAGPNGNVYAASNPPGEPSAIYEFQESSGEWRVFPPVPNYHWGGTGDIDVDSFATNLKDLNVDDDGILWIQWQSPTDTTYSTMMIDPNGA